MKDSGICSASCSMCEIPAIIKLTIVKCNLHYIIMEIMWFSDSLTGKFIKTSVDHRHFPFHRDNLSKVYAIFEQCYQKNQADFLLISLEKFEEFHLFWNLINFVESRIWIYLERNSLREQKLLFEKRNTEKVWIWNHGRCQKRNIFIQSLENLYLDLNELFTLHI